MPWKIPRRPVDRVAAVSLGVDAASGSLAADELNALVLNEVVEGADGVGTAADTSNDGVRQTAFLLQNLLLDFLGNHSLKVTNDGRERMRTHATERAEHSACPQCG